MLSSILTVALMSLTVSATPEEKRQATDAAQFTSAANELISKYIPSGALPELETSVSSAASVAKVTGDPKSLIYDALLATSLPSWFVSAVPADYSSQIAALEGDISALRGPATTGSVAPVVIAVTTTDSAGSTFTTSVTTSATVTATGTTVNVNSAVGSAYTTLTTQVVSGVTSVYSTVVSGGSSVASKITSGAVGVGSTVTSGAGGVLTTIISGGSSIVSAISSGGSSAISSSTSSGQGAIPTAVSGAAAGVLGLVGMMIAL